MMVIRAITREDSHVQMLGIRFPRLGNAVASRANQKSMTDEMVENALGFLRNFVRFSNLSNGCDIIVIDHVVEIGRLYEGLMRNSIRAKAIM